MRKTMKIIVTAITLSQWRSYQILQLSRVKTHMKSIKKKERNLSIGLRKSSRELAKKGKVWPRQSHRRIYSRNEPLGRSIRY